MSNIQLEIPCPECNNRPYLDYDLFKGIEKNHHWCCQKCKIEFSFKFDIDMRISYIYNANKRGLNS